jgi:hypothetical protein
MSFVTLQLSKRASFQARIPNAVIFWAPIAVLAGFVVVKLVEPRYRFLLREDGPVEVFTGLVYLAACLVALSIALSFSARRQQIYRVLYILLSGGFFFIFLEEINYGLSILSRLAPERFAPFMEQNEMNLHRLGGRRILHTVYILVSGYGALASFIVPRQIAERFVPLVNLLVPGRLLFFYFFSAFLFYLYIEYLSPVLVSLFGPQVDYGLRIDEGRFILLGDQEIPEFLLALGFALFVAMNRQRQLEGEFATLRNDSIARALRRADV